MKHFKIALLLLVVWTSASAQQDTATKFGIIIRTNGEIVFGTATEVTPEIIQYYRNDLADKTLYTIRRREVYAIVHSNQVTEIITPKVTNRDGGRNRGNDTLFSYNITHGIVRAGVGFVQNHGSVSTSGLQTSANGPGFVLGYAFKLNRVLKLGAMIGYNSFDYSSSSFSDYDQSSVNTLIKDRMFTPSVFAKYDILDSFICPYVMGGFALNIYNLTSTNDVFFIDNQRGVSFSGKIHGADFDVLLRAGLDLKLTPKFGAYIDVGTGINLMQLGVLFNLQ